jgi:predicted RNA-binding Zn-ribbon protein involved in translation (DUF1610 family)
MTLRFEQVESELPASLLPCPECGNQPTIYRRTDPWRYEVGTFIACENCVREWCMGRDDVKKRFVSYPADADWKPSLYEAVALWQMNAALLGVREEEGKDVPF